LVEVELSSWHFFGFFSTPVFGCFLEFDVCLASWSLFFKDLWTIVEFDDQAC